MVRQDEAYLSFQINHPVETTETLEDFWTAADELARETFAERAIHLPISGNGGSRSDGDKPPIVQSRSVGVPRHRMHDIERLNLHILDERMPRTARSGPLRRAYERFRYDPADQRTKSTPKVPKPQDSGPNWRQEIQQAAARHGVDPENIELYFDRLNFEINPGAERLGREISILPGMEQSQTLFIVDEMHICFNALARYNVGLAYPSSKLSPNVAICRTPANASDEQVVDYVEELKKHLPVRVLLGSLTLKSPN